MSAGQAERSGQAMRVLRTAVFAAATTVLAALAHAASGTVLPPADVLLAAGVGVGIAAFGLTRRERGLPAVLGATLGGQLVLHLVLTLSMVSSCAPAAGTDAAGPPVMAGMGRGSDLRGCAAGSWLPMTAAGRSAGVMVGIHVLAALVLAWWLRRGERALARCAVVVAGALAPVARRLAGALPVLGPPLRCAVPGGVPVPRTGSRVRHPGLRGAQVWARRGPPRSSRSELLAA
jgi:hypothetical protein